MIFSEKLKSLNEDELSILSFLVNAVPEERKQEIIEFSSIRLEVLNAKIPLILSKLTEEGKNVLENLINKIK